MDSAKFRRFSVILIVGLFLSLLVPGAIAQTATPAQPTPAGEFEISGNLESINSGFIIVSGQTISIIGAEINDPLMLGTRVKVHASFVNGQFIAREVENNGDDNANQNANANSNANSNDNVSAPPTITLQQAIATVLEVYPTTSIRSVELETRFGGTLVWDIEISNRTELTIDATTGVILTIEQPGDDDNGNGNSNDNNDDGDEDDDNLNGNVNDNSDDGGGSGANLNQNSNDNSDDNGGDNSGQGSDDDHDDDNSGQGSDDDHDDDNSDHGSDDGGGDNSGHGSDDDDD